MTRTSIDPPIRAPWSSPPGAPHVLQGAEVIDGVPVIYSLGDFYWPHVSGGLEPMKRLGALLVAEWSGRRLESFSLEPHVLRHDLTVGRLPASLRPDFAGLLARMATLGEGEERYTARWRGEAARLYRQRYRPRLVGVATPGMGVRPALRQALLPLAGGLGGASRRLRGVLERQELFILNCLQNESQSRLIRDGLAGAGDVPPGEALALEAELELVALVGRALRGRLPGGGTPDDGSGAG